MTFPLLGQPITVVRRTVTGRDAYGNDVVTETSSTVRGVFAPGGSVEQTDGRDTVIAQPTVYLPADTVLAAVDAVEVDGRRYQVDGTPDVWVSPFTGWAPGVEVRLQRVDG